MVDSAANAKVAQPVQGSLDVIEVHVVVGIDGHPGRRCRLERDVDGAYPVERADCLFDSVDTSGAPQTVDIKCLPRHRRLAPKLRSRKLFETTKNDENAIAAPAISGLSRPAAAIGMAATL